MAVSVYVGCRQHTVEPGDTIAGVLTYLKLNPVIAAVQLNSELLREDKFRTTVLKEGDVLECLVQCAGG